MSRRTVHHAVSEFEGFGRRLRERLLKCQTAAVASAFFTYAAYKEMAESLDVALASGAHLTFLLGRFDYITEPKAVRALLRLNRSYPDLIKVVFDRDFGFHYKLAVFDGKSHTAVLIGSSNLTAKGFSGRGEINVEIINQRRLYKDLSSDLMDRVVSAEPAASALPAYEALYRQHRKWRNARKRIERAGYARWRRRVLHPRPVESNDWDELDAIAHCNISGYVDDKKIKQNVAQVRKTAARRGLSIPAAWIHVPAVFAKLIADNDIFLITDDMRQSVGFATAKKVAPVIGENDRRAHIIFYRYSRGQKLVFDGGARYERLLALMRLGSKELLKRAAIRRVAKVLLPRLKRRSAK
jgi:hypothetical protein